MDNQPPTREYPDGHPFSGPKLTRAQRRARGDYGARPNAIRSTKAKSNPDGGLYALRLRRITDFVAADEARRAADTRRVADAEAALAREDAAKIVGGTVHVATPEGEWLEVGHVEDVTPR